MDKPTKILLGGIVCASIIASGQLFRNHWLENQLKQIEAECIAEGKTEILEGARLLCNAEDLERLAAQTESLPRLQGGDIIDQVAFAQTNPNAVIVQAKLVFAYREFQAVQANSWPYPVAALIVGISALPWLWYFLLRRIRELRDAIVGKGT